MAAMSALVWFLVLMMMMMKSYAASVETITVSTLSGEAVLLRSDLLRSDLLMEHRWDIRWTHDHLLLNMNRTVCHHGRCELLSDGSLRFSRVHFNDSGKYTLELFDEEGKLRKKKYFLLQLEESSSSSSSKVGGSAPLYCLCLMLLLLPFIIFFILRRRRRRIQRTAITGQKEENIYMVMHGRRGNKGEGEEEKKQDTEEECPYVLCSPVVPMETVDDIYV